MLEYQKKDLRLYELQKTNPEAEFLCLKCLSISATGCSMCGCADKFSVTICRKMKGKFFREKISPILSFVIKNFKKK